MEKETRAELQKIDTRIGGLEDALSAMEERFNRKIDANFEVTVTKLDTILTAVACIIYKFVVFTI